MNYLNDWDEYAADWLTNLVTAGHLPPAVIDRRSIRDVHGADLNPYTQCHFFAGIGGWPLALRLAGWPDNQPVWTGSCPCQPFSRVGKRKGTEDERHLWPDFLRLIRIGRPVWVFGEQIGGDEGIEWCEGVQAGLEGEGYGFVAAELCAAGVSYPQNRGRIYWGGVRTDHFRPVRFASDCGDDGDCPDCGIDYAECECPGPTEDGVLYAERDGELVGGRLVCARGAGPQGYGWNVEVGHEFGWLHSSPNGSSAKAGRVYLAECELGKWRRVQPGAFPLAYGIPAGVGRGVPELASLVRNAKANRVGRIRGYGNAIVPAVGAMFLRSVMEWIDQ